MQDYKITGDELIANMPDLAKDTDGNKIIGCLEYVVSEFGSGCDTKIKIRTLDSFRKDRLRLKSMIYVMEGFEKYLKILESAKITTIDGIQKTIDEVVGVFIELEDFDNAKKLTDEWNERLKTLTN